MTRSCIALLSGGLDSLVAMRLMVRQGLAVTALNAVNCFHGAQAVEDKKARLTSAALALGAKDVLFPDKTREVIQITRRPRHGYGKHLNACIDCRLITIRAGFDAMQAIGADFVVSGEVIGQRPMSQRKNAMELADRKIAEWGFSGRLLRPLCAKLLPKTVPELEGWVDESNLFALSGRSREGQIALAAELGIESYPNPAGGCLLTDPLFSERLAVLASFNHGWNATDVELLKVGRHFQISPDTKLVASRCEDENYRLRDLSRPDDLLFIAAEQNGAIVMLRGTATPEAEAAAAGLALRYSRQRSQPSGTVERWRVENGEDIELTQRTADQVDPGTLRERERQLCGGNPVKTLRKQGCLPG